MSDYTEVKLNKRVNQRSNCIMNRKANSKAKHIPSLANQKEIVSSVNEVALYLYNYYISIATIPHFDLLNDTVVGRSIGWTTRKVKDNRLKLAKAGHIYFHQKRHSGVLHSVWIFGTEEIANYKTVAADITVNETISKDVYILTAKSEGNNLDE